MRSSKDDFVKVSGRRWPCLLLLVPLPWAGCCWALPFLAILAPSERHDRQRGSRHKKLTDWARQALLRRRRWLPERALVVVVVSQAPPHLAPMPWCWSAANSGARWLFACPIATPIS